MKTNHLDPKPNTPAHRQGLNWPLSTLLPALVFCLHWTPRADTFHVTTTGDSDGLVGSLRQAIVDANGNPGPDVIEFDIPGFTNALVQLETALPVITDTATIDGTTQSGDPVTPGIELDGSLLTYSLGAPGLLTIQYTTDCVIRGLILYGSPGDGIHVFESDHTVVEGNFIGTDSTGSEARGNTGCGIFLSQSDQCRVGGTSPGSGNLISGNGTDTNNPADGISLSLCMGTTIQGNSIGTDRPGQRALGNGGAGIRLSNGSSSNTIGGLESAARNVISGNRSAGIAVGSSENTIQGNFIGVDARGTSPLGNGAGGVHLYNNGLGRTSGNLVGGTNPAARNLISGNHSDTGSTFGVDFGGVSISGTACFSNLVQGNFIGTDVTGSQTVANLGPGILVGSAGPNLLGGTMSGAGNVISGNDYGIYLVETTGSVVQGNWIGTDASGRNALGNIMEGVGLYYAAGNTIGGTGSGARNVISANGNDGVTLTGSDCTNNVVQGNFIGVDASGTNALGNGRAGVSLTRYVASTDSASKNLIGGAAPGAGNVISANAAAGVRVMDWSAAENVIQGNLIGTDATGTQALGNGNGILVWNAPDNTIGGVEPGAGNVISGNQVGLMLTQPSASGNVVQGNWIGLKRDGASPLPNLSHGIVITTDARGNLIGGSSADAANRIVSNGGNGIWVESGSGNRFQQNAISANSGLGIDLAPAGVTANDVDDADAGANELQNYPTLNSAVALPGSIDIQGELQSGPGRSYTIEFFRNESADASGNGEGAAFLGATTVTTDGTGSASITASLPVVVPAGRYVSATATDESGNTSEFSPCIQVAGGQAFHTLTVQKAGTGSGRVTSQPVGIDCGADCSEDLAPGTVVTLAATPDAGSTFAGWGGDGSGDTDRTVTMDGVKTVVATFNLSGAASADLSVAILANPPSVNVGESLTYTITVTNGGPSEATGVVVTNTLPDHAPLLSVTSSQGTHATNGNVLTFTLGSLANGGSATISLAVTTTLTGAITNTAGTTAAETDPNPANNSAFVETLVAPIIPTNHAPTFAKGPDQSVREDAGLQTVLGWATALSAGPPEESGQALTFQVSNDNNAWFAVPPAITPDGTLTYTPAPNAAGSATVTVVLKDDGGTAHGGVDASAPQTFTITVIGPPVELAIFANAAPNPVSIGSNLVVRLTVANASSSAAQGVVVTNPVPAGASFVSASASRGTCTLADGAVVCSLGSLNGGASATLTINLVPTVFGSIVDTASVSATAADPNPTNNWTSVSTRVMGPPIVVQVTPGDPSPTLQLFVPQYPGYNTIVQYTDALGPTAVWTDLPGAPHVEWVTITNNVPVRFYRTILVPQ